MSKNTMEIDQTSQQRRESLYGDRKAKLARMVEIRLLEDSL